MCTQRCAAQLGPGQLPHEKVPFWLLLDVSDAQGNVDTAHGVVHVVPLRQRAPCGRDDTERHQKLRFARKLRRVEHRLVVACVKRCL